MDFDIKTLEKAISEFRALSSSREAEIVEATAEKICRLSRVCTIAFMDDCLWQNTIPEAEKHRLEQSLENAVNLIGITSHASDRIETFARSIKARLMAVRDFQLTVFN